MAAGLIQEVPTLEGILGAAREIAATGECDLSRRRMRLLRRLSGSLEGEALRRATAHSEAVARTATRLAQLMRLDALEIGAARMVGLLHGLGALAPGGSAGDDAARICAALGAPEDLCLAVGQVGQRHDAGALELGARIVTVADRIEREASKGPSCAKAFTEALTALRRGRGTLYDPAVVVAAHLLGASAMSHAA